MKIRHPWLIKSATALGTLLMRGWMATLRYKHHAVGPNVDPLRDDLRERFVYSFWHETFLLPAFHYARPGSKVLISRSNDGNVIADICVRLGFVPVRGSTSKSGIEALRQLIGSGQQTHIGMTPDGPRGPRRVVQPGVVYLAARTGMPIVPTGFAMCRPWRFNSWDRFCVPKLFSRVACVLFPPISIPPLIETSQLEPYRLQLQQAMDEATLAAEELAETGALTQRPPHAGTVKQVA